MKAADLIGLALDWAVAKCEGRDIRPGRWRGKFSSNDGVWKPSETWSQAGPIIEREFIRIGGDYNGWEASMWCNGPFEAEGHTPLIAAMRCYVASKLGDEVEVPEALL